MNFKSFYYFMIPEPKITTKSAQSINDRWERSINPRYLHMAVAPVPTHKSLPFSWVINLGVRKLLFETWRLEPVPNFKHTVCKPAYVFAMFHEHGYRPTIACSYLVIRWSLPWPSSWCSKRAFLLRQLPRHVLHKKYCVFVINFYVVVCYGGHGSYCLISRNAKIDGLFSRIKLSNQSKRKRLFLLTRTS